MKIIKKVNLLFILICLSVIISLNSFAILGFANNNDNEYIKIGIPLAVTGTLSGYGIGMVAASEMAVEEINAEGGVLGKKLKLVHYDTASDRKQVVNVVRKMIDEGILFIAGPLASQETELCFPITNEAKVIAMSGASLAPGIPDPYPFAFRNTASEAKLVPQAVEYILKVKEPPIKTVVTFQVQDDPYGSSMADEFKKAFEAHGIPIAITLPYNQGETDFSARVTRAMSYNPDAMVLAGLYNEQCLIMLEARRQGFVNNYLDGAGFSSPVIFDIAGDAANGAFFISTWSTEIPATKEFAEKFRARTGKEPQQSDGNQYDIIRVIAQAIKNAGTATDTEKVRIELNKIKNFPGPSGILGFEESGDAIRKGYPTLIKDRKFLILPESPEEAKQYFK